MREWENYTSTEEYQNSFRWAAHEEHRQGSMWAAFMAGFLAVNPDGAKSDSANAKLSQLRPLAEADEVPEGCLRFYTYKKDEKWTSASQFPCSQDTHFVEVRLPYLDPEYKPSTKLAEKPETFEAHGKIWTKHKPGDPMPCDGSSAVMALLGDGTYSTQLAEDWAWNNHYSKFDIVGWRYSDEPTPEPYADKPAPINDGGPAFPITENGLQGYNGMSLRDYFAGQALAGSDISTVMAEALKAGATSDEFSQILSMSVYKIADAMLAAREVKP